MKELNRWVYAVIGVIVLLLPDRIGVLRSYP